jgi:hypothetical protein
LASVPLGPSFLATVWATTFLSALVFGTERYTAPRPGFQSGERGNGIRQFSNLRFGEVGEKPLCDDPAICVDMERLLRLASARRTGNLRSIM